MATLFTSKGKLSPKDEESRLYSFPLPSTEANQYSAFPDVSSPAKNTLCDISLLRVSKLSLFPNPSISIPRTLIEALVISIMPFSAPEMEIFSTTTSTTFTVLVCEYGTVTLSNFTLVDKTMFILYPTFALPAK